ncbi:MAG: hypothetical protein RBT57_07275 [Paludibacter sp.]|nr:hypothetical protein [Paludibacter sp.]
MRTILFLTIAVITMASCEGTYSAPEDLTTKQVFNFEVKASDWKPYTDQAGLNLYYRSKFSLSGISDYMYNNGAVNAYIEFDGYQQVLPYSRHMENANGAKWTRTVDFDYSRTDIQFYVTNNDFISDPPETMYFRVVFIW